MFSALFSKGLQKAGNKVTNTDHEVLIKSIIRTPSVVS